MIRTCSDQRTSRPRTRRQSSISTGKPSPPTTEPIASGTQIQASVAKEIMLSEKRANPALLYADREWKTPR